MVGKSLKNQNLKSKSNCLLPRGSDIQHLTSMGNGTIICVIKNDKNIDTHLSTRVVYFGWSCLC